MKKRSIVKWVIAVIILALIAFGGYSFLNLRNSMKQSNEVLEVMKTLVPNLGVDTGVSTGQGRDPLAALSIQDIDIVGCLEIPSQDLMVPVTAAGYERDGFVTAVSGSPVKGQFRLTGSHDDVFRDLSDADPGDNIVFTDIDGVRYKYRVVTQFHLKNWDEADYDLMLCYDTDSQTQFVLGCSYAE